MTVSSVGVGSNTTIHDNERKVMRLSGRIARHRARGLVSGDLADLLRLRTLMRIWTLELEERGGRRDLLTTASNHRFLDEQLAREIATLEAHGS